MTSHTYMHTHWLRVYCVTASSRWLPGRRRRHPVRHSRRSRRHVCWVGAIRTSHTRAPVVAATSTYNVKTSNKNARAAEASPQGNIDQMLLYLTANQRSCPLAPLAPPTSDIVLNFGFTGGGKNLLFKNYNSRLCRTAFTNTLHVVIMHGHGSRTVRTCT